jgi:hypothetical protein
MEELVANFCAVTGATSEARVVDYIRGLGEEVGLELLITGFFEMSEREQAGKVVVSLCALTDRE